MSDGRVDYEVVGGMARLVLNQPKRLNAMSFDMWIALGQLVARAEADANIRAIVVEGAGDKAFCSGADISQFGEKRSSEEAVAAYEEAVRAGLAALAHAQKPTLAVIRGICFGGGLALAMSCDLRLAREGARFCIPAAKLGLGYAHNSLDFVVRRIGLSATADIFYSARQFDAPEAQRLGIANHIWPEADFEAQVEAYLARIAGNAPLTLRALAVSLRELAKPEGARDRRVADEAVAACFASEDYAEGRRAFAEKRAPEFKGR
jgi:enoyl-CoA hydratase/carnithine racemase